MKTIIGTAGLLILASATWAGDATTAGTLSQSTQAVIKAPPSEVWKVFSTNDGFKKLGSAQAEIDFRVGGLIRSHYNPKGVIGDEGTIHNAILSYEPERMISFRIVKPPKGFPFSEATWKETWSVATLTDLGDGRTQLRITGLGYPNTEEGEKMRKFFEDGNDYTLKVLQNSFDSTSAKPTGPAHGPTPLAPISLERMVDLPRDEVWRLYTTADGWKHTVGCGCDIELRPGGKFELHFAPNAPPGQRGSDGCTVLSLIPKQMISYTWNAPPKFEHARANHTWVVVHFDELAPNRTRIRLDHMGFAEKATEFPDHRAEWEQVREYFNAAWGKVLDAVKAKEAKS